MSHYHSNVKDLEFTLFETLGLDATLAHPLFDGVDRATVHDIFEEVRRLAEGPLADAFVAGDRTPPSFDPSTGSVVLPEAIKQAYRTVMAAEWWRMELPASLGGTPVPPSVRWAVAEMLLGANPAVFLYAGGPGFAGVLHQLGTPRQKELAATMLERGWAATMVLTEPDAGSDVGAGRTVAELQDDGSWHLRGVKRFITGGEHDLADNIVHFVLARPVGVPGHGGPGTKGLSMFIVPKYHADWGTGTLGERNGVYATALEHKMGLKASSTCELAFGQGGIPAKGWLVGEEHDGIAQMFKIIEWARMMVGTKAIATLSSGYLNALDYARIRIQGADITQAADKAAPRVPILTHPDVRRMLMMQKAYAEGMRALVLYTASWQDRVEMARADGDTAALGEAERMNDLLLPLVKGLGSERSYEMLGLSLQVLGGSGYLQDYPMEQYLRDAKVDTLYEGTTGIQGQDFVFRKLFKDQFRSWLALSREMQESLAHAPGWAQPDAARVSTALESVNAMGTALAGWAMTGEPRRIRDTAENTTRVLLAAGDLLVGWLLLRQAIEADRLMREGDGSRQEFLEGKKAVAHFYARTVLPRLSAELEALEATDGSLQEIPDGAF